LSMVGHASKPPKSICLIIADLKLPRKD